MIWIVWSDLNIDIIVSCREFDERSEIEYSCDQLKEYRKDYFIILRSINKNRNRYAKILDTGIQLQIISTI
jgi:hypothetical protein